MAPLSVSVQAASLSRRLVAGAGRRGASSLGRRSAGVDCTPRTAAIDGAPPSPAKSRHNAKRAPRTGERHWLGRGALVWSLGGSSCAIII